MTDGRVPNVRCPWSSGRWSNTFPLSPLCKIPSQLKGKTFRMTYMRINSLPWGLWPQRHHHKSKKCWPWWPSPAGSFSWVFVLLRGYQEVLATYVTGEFLSVDLTPLSLDQPALGSLFAIWPQPGPLSRTVTLLVLLSCVVRGGAWHHGWQICWVLNDGFPGIRGKEKKQAHQNPQVVGINCSNF